MGSIDYHLQRAAAHLEVALSETKPVGENEEIDKAVAEKWEQFMACLFGNLTKTNVTQ